MNSTFLRMTSVFLISVTLINMYWIKLFLSGRARVAAMSLNQRIGIEPSTSLTAPNLSKSIHVYSRAVVTGASFNHFDVLVSFIVNYQKMNQHNVPLFVYDLGLEKSSVTWLHKQFPFLHLRQFDFEQFPSYFDININRGQYAWKSVIIKEMLDTTAVSVLWLDAGNRLWNNAVLDNAFDMIEKNGYITTSTSGTLKQWVHPGMLSFFKFEHIDKPMCNGAIIGFSLNHTDVYSTIVVTWSHCALVKSCIAPFGSSRKNHRQDQAALSVLLHQSRRKCDIPEGSWSNNAMIPGPLGIQLHQDENVQHVQLDSNNVWCGCKYEDDQNRVIQLKTAAFCASCKTLLNQIPEYLHDLVLSPDISAGGRKAPRLILFAEKYNAPTYNNMTFVMPIYNAHAAVSQSLPSILKTASGNWDLVLVLDACYDESLDVVQKVIQEHFYTSSCQRVRVLEQPTAIWETSSDNLGMRVSNPNNAYVLIQADNIMTEVDWNKKMWKQFELNSKIFARYSTVASRKTVSCKKKVLIPRIVTVVLIVTSGGVKHRRYTSTTNRTTVDTQKKNVGERHTA